MPLGESVTRAKLGGGYVCGGGGGSSSSQASSNYDNRVAVQDGIGLSASNNNTVSTTNQSWLNVTTTDAGIVSRGLDTVDKGLAGMLGTIAGTNKQSLDFVDGAFGGMLGTIKDTNKQAFTVVDSALDYSSESFSKLLQAQKSMFDTSQGLIGQTQKSVADAYAQAQTEAKGTIDNKTIMVLGVAAAVALVAMNQKG